MVEETAVDDLLTERSLAWVAATLREWLSNNEAAQRLQAEHGEWDERLGWGALVEPMSRMNPEALQAAHQWLTSAVLLHDTLVERGSLSYPPLRLVPKTDAEIGADVERDELAAEVERLRGEVRRLRTSLAMVSALAETARAGSVDDGKNCGDVLSRN